MHYGSHSKIILAVFVIIFTTYLLTLNTILDDRYIADEIGLEEINNTTIDTDNLEGLEDTIEVVHPEILREDGYNTILISFYEKVDDATITAMPTDIELYAIYSKYDAFYNMDDALDAGVIKQLKSVGNFQYQFLLKEGYKLNAQLNPINKEQVSGWSDDKANFPIELTTIEEGNMQLNVFDMTFNYKSRLLEVNLETNAYS